MGRRQAVWRAAVMVGKTHVLCNIRTGLTDEDEAHLFVTQEENVTKLTQYDKFIAACASGEEHGKVALLLRDICDEYGIKIKKACGKNSAGVLTAICLGSDTEVQICAAHTESE